MTKYIIALVVLIVAGGLFMYSTQVVQAPTSEQRHDENPFGEGSTEVGTVENPSSASSENMKEATMTENEPSTNVGTPSPTIDNSATTPAPQPGVITLTELAKHRSQSDCWVGYKGTVYDITNWLPRHPGSAEAIAPFCGTADDFAAAFNQQHGTTREARLEKEGQKEGTLGN